MLQQVKTRKSNRIPARFKPHSIVLAEQLDVLFNRAYDKESNISTGDDTAYSHDFDHRFSPALIA